MIHNNLLSNIQLPLFKHPVENKNCHGLVTFLFIITLFLFTSLSNASVVTGFSSENDNWFLDDGEDGLTYVDVLLLDISPVWIEFNGSWKTSKNDEEFAITLWNSTGTYLTNLHLRWEKQDIDLSYAPVDAYDLNFQFLTREINSAILTEQNSGSDFHELWFDFVQGMGSGILILDFEWINFNNPIDDFTLFIEVNKEEQTNPVPIPNTLWLFFTGLFGLRSIVRKYQL